MNMPAREMKWVVGGFVGGFMACYLLLGALRQQPAGASALAKVTPASAWPLLPTPAAAMPTNLPAKEFHLHLPPRWVGTSPEPAGPGYSTDLIDDHR